MRLTAAWQHQMTPSTFSSMTSRTVCVEASSSLPIRPVMPALFTKAVSGGSSASTAAKSRSTSSSRATSACSAMAWPPSLSISATTASAATALLR
jgi:hypothetical protein